MTAPILATITFDGKNESCPKCKVRRYEHPNLKLYVSPCYHPLCEACLDRVFIHGAAACPTCGKRVSKHGYWIPQFEDLNVEKEVVVRKQLAKIFNKKERDFRTLAEYNDYLEQIEDFCYNLVQDIDTENTNKRIKEYAEANKSDIQEAQHQALLEKKALEEREAMLLHKRMQERQDILLQERQEEEDRVKNNADMINELANAKDENSVTAIQNRYATRSIKRIKLTTAVKEEVKDVVRMSLSTPVISMDPIQVLYAYPTASPALMDLARQDDTLELWPWNVHDPCALASGWHPQFQRKRALDACLIGLSVVPL